MPKRSMKELEMSVCGLTSEEWDRQEAEAREALARIRAEYEAEQLAKFDAGLLEIGCEEKPKEIFCYARRGVDYELWGMKSSTLDCMADRAYSINW